MSRIATADRILEARLAEAGLEAVDGATASSVPQDGSIIRLVYVRIPASLIDETERAMAEHPVEILRREGLL